MSNKPPEVDATEAAALFGVNVATISRWRNAGKLPAVGRRPARGTDAYLYDRELVERRAAARREYLGLDPLESLEPHDELEERAS